jgi:hypothetical protein
MKRAAVSILVSLALASQAFAVLRPLFPTKPAPPFGGDAIVIGDDTPRDSWLKKRCPPRGKIDKRCQLFIRSHNETFSVAMGINNPDRSPVGINH